MVGKIMIRVRNLWIMIVAALVLIIVATLLLVSGSQSKREIPQKGVFVLEKGNLDAEIEQL